VLNEGITEEIAKHDFDLAGVVPADDLVYEYDSNGTPTTQLPESSPARAAMMKIFDAIIG
jgi:CO dehydrogenase maturation factor